MQLNRYRFAGATTLILIGMMISACSGSLGDSGTPPPADWVDTGSWYVREAWPHDGNPFESRRFVVYGDSVSVEARTELAETVERVWDEILTEMSIDPDLLALPSGQEKYDIYAFEDRSPDWAGKAYYGGLIVSSPHRQILFGLIRIDSQRLEATIKHELVHVASESLLHGGGLAEPPWVPVWFFEGLAEVVSRGTGSGAIAGKDHLDYLTSSYGQLNPVSYESDEGIEGGAGAYTEYHYPMRRLAVEYLFDDDGYNVPMSQGTALLVDMAGGKSFDDVFADRIGVRVADYEDRFFDLMEEYLPDRSIPIALTPLGLIVLTGTLICAAIAFTVWRTRGPAATTAGATAVRSRKAAATTIGFVVWLAVVSAFSLGIFLVGTYSISVSWGLSGLGQVLGVSAMVIYFIFATFMVNWALQSRSARPLLAWLIPLAAVFVGVAPIMAVVIIAEVF